MGLIDKLKLWLMDWMVQKKVKNQLYKQAYMEQELKEVQKKAKRDCRNKYKPNKTQGMSGQDNFMANFTPEKTQERLFGKNGGFL